MAWSRTAYQTAYREAMHCPCKDCKAKRTTERRPVTAKSLELRAERTRRGRFLYYQQLDPEMRREFVGELFR